MLLSVTSEGTYSITIKATKAGYVTKTKTETVTVKPEPKIGDIYDYNPPGGGTWRVFYIDKDNYFGDGVNTIYLKRDYDPNLVKNIYGSYNLTDTAKNNFLKYNKKWNNNNQKFESTSKYSSSDRTCATVYNPSYFTSYVNSQTEFVSGSPSVEMFVKSINQYCNTSLSFEIGSSINASTGASTTGYLLYSGKNMLSNNNLAGVHYGIDNNEMYFSKSGSFWVASPHLMGDGGYNPDLAWISHSSYKQLREDHISGENAHSAGLCPVVRLK